MLSNCICKEEEAKSQCAPDAIIGDILRDRDVVILLPGPSILQLESRITELKDVDICYASVNDFWVMEKFITSQIERNVEVILCSAKECGVPTDKHLAYLNRPERNIFMTTKRSVKDESFLETYKDKIILFEAVEDAFTLPNCKELRFPAMASISGMIPLLIIGGVKRIFLFGADGGGRPDNLYFKGWDSNSLGRLLIDTRIMNRYMPDVLQRTYRLWDKKPIEILNVSPKTAYTWAKVIDYDEAIGLLKNG